MNGRHGCWEAAVKSGGKEVGMGVGVGMDQIIFSLNL